MKGNLHNLLQLQSVSAFVRKDMSNKMKGRRNRLFHTGAKCYYCGCVMTNKKMSTLKKRPENKCTLEHIFSMYDIRRLLSDFEKHTVLCCLECNVSRGQKEEKEIYKSFDYTKRAFTVNPASQTIILSPEIFKTA